MMLLSLWATYLDVYIIFHSALTISVCPWMVIGLLKVLHS